MRLGVEPAQKIGYSSGANQTKRQNHGLGISVNNIVFNSMQAL